MAIEKGQDETVNKWYPRWVNYECAVTTKGQEFYTPLVATFVILLSKDYTKEKKIEIFKQKFKSINDPIFLEAYLELKEKNYSKFEKLLLSLDLNGNNSMFFSSNYILNKEIINYCKSNKESKACKHLESYKKFFKDKDLNFEFN